MPNDKLPIKIVESERFKKDIKKLGKRYRLIREDIKPLVEQLETGETPGDRIAENKYAVYKVRIKNSDIKKGQGGGYRVIYYIRTPAAILLTNIYSKSDRSDISNKEIEDIIESYELEIEQQDPEIMTTDPEVSDC